MNGKLFAQAITKFSCGIVCVCLLLFIPAGTWIWTEAWLFLGLLFVPMLIVGFILMVKNPQLLEKRLNMQEREVTQSRIIALSGIQFIGAFIVAGLDQRFGWTDFPGFITAASAVLFLSAYVLYGEVLRENTYLSRTVEVQEEQKVIDTGLYALVRHPMYFAAVLLFWSMPLVLGSLPAFLIMLPYPLLLIKRVLNEEQVLAEGLAGYREYMEKVKYRMIPFVW